MTKNNNGIIYAALIVIVIMGGVIAVQQEQMRAQNPENLPVCEYSTIMTMPSQYEGYYIGVDGDHKIVCAQSLIREGAVVDFGL
jgi:hypothetical protein